MEIEEGWRNHHALFSYVSRPCRDGSPVFYYSAECLKQKAITNGLHSHFEKRKMMKIHFCKSEFYVSFVQSVCLVFWLNGVGEGYALSLVLGEEAKQWATFST